MCGISGEIRFDRKTPNVNAVTRMNDVLRPRGPDGSGVYQTQNVAFGHRRLKVIDLSDSASQPMIDSQLGLTIVFNGCIYNYRELRQELIQEGYQFFSKGDTEVLMKVWHAWGLEGIKRLQGMFAFAIHESKTGRVIIGRDRLGIKPLYISSDQKRLRFASTLPALLAGGGVNTDIDMASLHHYLSFHSVVPAPKTIVQGVQKLPPATVRIIDRNGYSVDQSYWNLRFGTPEPLKDCSFEEWKEQTLAVLTKSVKRRLEADVPVGILLSGGLDSSLIVGLLAELGQKDISTYSVGFESAGGESGDEFAYSDIIAKHFSTNHHQITIASKDLLPALGDCVKNMSEPMMSHDVIGFYLLSREVSKSLKVVQSGQGADEIFGGYHWYPPLVDSNNALEDYSRVFFDRDHPEYLSMVQQRFRGQNYSKEFVELYFSSSDANHAVDKALNIDTRVMLVEDPVKRVDNMTMAWGLEARVPFLDHELVELAAQMPYQYKLAQEGKGILKEVARSVIPHEIIDRPKGYFPVPALKYIEGDYLEFVRTVLQSGNSNVSRLFQKKYIKELLDDPKSHITPLRGSKLWQIALLDFWLQTHGISV